ncbi:selenoneine biosynthesis selenosugar synthase SenB [Halomonas saccharevitans]|uniref:Selenoneine biosynthesis selenosugar synthase SenB n=1 Tax=Halomonas saccharevitans TaxID=416872 RepID=A0ABU3NEE5_9GAMM|nr:selenoneine biosynthesis selenosugar synthase SenB [Halomonas saccharevitans]MDT8879522.1 selenoneine biosynthesis selenosugar synthase SenB [Halomonas saccharevitans]
MKVALITPAGRGSHAGNRATATRWAGLLRELGCRVSIAGSEDAPKEWRVDGQAPDLVVALHAWRSHVAILACRQAFPAAALAVVLTGTDVYRFQHSHPETFHESLAAADVLIGLHDALEEDLPAGVLPRLHVVHQSALPLPPGAPRPGRRHFDVLVVGHLREEKDPLRAALAVRDLPMGSRLRIIQLGGAHDESWAKAAVEEMADNPRYRWLGDLPRWRVRQWMARARLMVISSRMEGGANVVSEACAAGLPVLASDIPGNRGLLGGDHAGYFPVADTAALGDLLRRAEAQPAFVEGLRRQVAARAPLFTPEAEREALARVITACGLHA